MTIIDCVVYAKSTCKSIAPSRLSRVDCQVDFPATLPQGLQRLSPRPREACAQRCSVDARSGFSGMDHTSVTVTGSISVHHSANGLNCPTTPLRQRVVRSSAASAVSSPIANEPPLTPSLCLAPTPPARLRYAGVSALPVAAYGQLPQRSRCPLLTCMSPSPLSSAPSHLLAMMRLLHPRSGMWERWSLLCALLWSVALCGSCEGSEWNCWGPSSGRGSPDLSPTLHPVSPVLPFLDNSVFNLTICSWSFADFEESYRLYLSNCYNYPRFNVHTCPQHCLQAMQLDPSAARVYGSFPYHANSSICLAAILAGAVSSEHGGGLFIERFWPQDWSGIDSQTIFPHHSAAASLSNGVQSWEVPNSWYSLPSPLLSYSWTVRTRGVGISQRQTAPFSPRAGHLLLSLPNLASPASDAETSWHLVIGGMNSTHYMVRLGHAHRTAAAFPPHSSVTPPSETGQLTDCGYIDCLCCCCVIPLATERRLPLLLVRAVGRRQPLQHNQWPLLATG